MVKIAKKTVKYTADVEITSASYALEMSKKLPSIWSSESLLSQRVLIYIAKLIEEQNVLLSLLVHLPPNIQPKRMGLSALFENWLKKRIVKNV